MVVEGEIEAGKLYEETDFNRSIEIREREKKRVEIFMSQINQNEKTLVFCANQAHALLVRDLINQLKRSKDPNYCQRVTADDGSLGEQHLRDFQDNEKTIPTILTTSQKLSTGVDARNIRNIVLMRPINSMIEFKQNISAKSGLISPYPCQNSFNCWVCASVTPPLRNGRKTRIIPPNPSVPASLSSLGLTRNSKIQRVTPHDLPVGLLSPLSTPFTS